MRTKSDNLTITTPATQEPEESNWLWSGGFVYIIVFLIVFCIACRSICDTLIIERMKQRLRKWSCCRNNGSNCDCGVCEAKAGRCWRTITSAFSRRIESNSDTGNTSAEAPPTIAVSRLSIIIVDHRVDPPPSVTLPPSYDSIVTNPSEPPPSYEEAVR